jgi:hypothetical protein
VDGEYVWEYCEDGLWIEAWWGYEPPSTADLEGLTPVERELMRLRYIDGAEWLDVAETIHYEWSQTHRIHARALAKIKNL